MDATKSVNCPMCGQPFDAAVDTLMQCPECGRNGSTACCMMGGRGCQCVDCEGGDDAEE